MRWRVSAEARVVRYDVKYTSPPSRERSAIAARDARAVGRYQIKCGGHASIILWHSYQMRAQAVEGTNNKQGSTHCET